MNQADGSFEPFPTKVGRGFALGLTYEGHMREAGERPKVPVIFDKACAPDIEPQHVTTPTEAEMYDALTALDAGIAARLKSKLGSLPALFDYEVEIGMVLLEPVTPAKLQAAD